MELRGMNGIVTGASRGLGRRLAVALAERGVDLVLAARNVEGLQATIDEVSRHGTRAFSVPCDVRDGADLEKLVDATLDRLGPPGLLINNAGIESVAHFHRMSLDEIEDVMTTNSLAPMWLSRLVVPHMTARGRGHIVNISSTAGKIGMPYFAPYAASKHALVGFSWCLRQELGPLGVGVSVVCPGFISETGMTHQWVRRKRPALAREVPPERVVKAVLDAISKDKAEVVVGSGLAPLSDVAFAVSPDLASKLLRVAGVHDYFASEADARSGR